VAAPLDQGADHWIGAELEPIEGLAVVLVAYLELR
jgi:hypothetical protein